MNHPRIDINEKIMFGKPVIKGTRITVELILRKLSSGLNFHEILSQHPNLQEEDIHAAEGYAADVISNEEIIYAGDTTS